MTAIPVPDTLTAIAALIAAFGSLIAAVKSSRASHRVGVQLHQANDDANLSADKIQHLLEMQKAQRDTLRSQGHQIGEVKDDVCALRKDLSTLIAKEILK